MISTLRSELPSAEICKRNVWPVGTVLVADSSTRHPSTGRVRIKLTAIGDGVVLARPIDGTELGHEDIYDLHTRDWQPANVACGE